MLMATTSEFDRDDWDEPARHPDSVFWLMLYGQREHLVRFACKKFRIAREEAEDLAHTTLIMAFEAPNRFYEGNLTSYLCTVLVRRAYVELRTAWQRNVVRCDDPTRFAGACGARQEDQVFVSQVLAKIKVIAPSRFKMMVLLAFENKYQEVADLLGFKTDSGVNIAVPKVRRALLAAVLPPDDAARMLGAMEVKKDCLSNINAAQIEEFLELFRPGATLQNPANGARSLGKKYGISKGAAQKIVEFSRGNPHLSNCQKAVELKRPRAS